MNLDRGFVMRRFRTGDLNDMASADPGRAYSTEDMPDEHRKLFAAEIDRLARGEHNCNALLKPRADVPLISQERVNRLRDEP